MKIWVDDLRDPPDDTWMWCKSSEQTLQALSVVRRYQLANRTKIVIDEMSLDHDLGGDDTSRPVVMWMCYFDYWPSDVYVHSMNPVGRDWLKGMIARYKV